jgi:hypothetical protein
MENIGKLGFINYKMVIKRLQGGNAIKIYITSYYRNLFGPPPENNFHLDETCEEDIL